MDAREKRFREQALLRPHDQAAQERLQRYMNAQKFHLKIRPVALAPKRLTGPISAFLMRVAAAILIIVAIGCIVFAFHNQGAQFFTGIFAFVFAACLITLSRL